MKRVAAGAPPDEKGGTAHRTETPGVVKIHKHSFMREPNPVFSNSSERLSCNTETIYACNSMITLYIVDKSVSVSPVLLPRWAPAVANCLCRFAFRAHNAAMAG